MKLALLRRQGWLDKVVSSISRVKELQFASQRLIKAQKMVSDRHFPVGNEEFGFKDVRLYHCESNAGYGFFIVQTLKMCSNDIEYVL